MEMVLLSSQFWLFCARILNDVTLPVYGMIHHRQQKIEKKTAENVEWIKESPQRITSAVFYKHKYRNFFANNKLKPQK